MTNEEKVKVLEKILSLIGIFGTDIHEIRHNSHLNNYMVISVGGETIFSMTKEAYEELGNEEQRLSILEMRKKISQEK